MKTVNAKGFIIIQNFKLKYETAEDKLSTTYN